MDNQTTSKEIINYDDLLNVWAEKLYVEHDRVNEIAETADVGTYKHGHCVGFCKGLIAALTMLTILEKKYIKDVKKDSNE